MEAIANWLTRSRLTIRSILRSGGSLPEDIWTRRFSFLLGLTWLHAGVIALVGPLAGYSWQVSASALFREATVLHGLLEALIVAIFALVGCCKRAGRTFQGCSVALGLMASSAILVHSSGGYIELHFHFFVMLTFLALLQDWVPYILAILFVALHHGVMGTIWPEEVFNHPAAINAPWTWGGIHALFVLSSAIGSIIAWRFNEKALDRIKKQAAELEQANKLQADFSAMIAHDLRSPLSTVLNTAALMQEGVFGDVSEDQRKWLEKSQNTCRSMIQIISDFLDVSKIEAGHLDLIKERIDLYQLINNSLESYAPTATLKNVALTGQIEDDLPEITADARRLDQVLSNLITNAIKFTSPGGAIEVGASRVGEGVRIWVKDNGEGIPPEEIGQLFQKYRQTKSGCLAPGTGLGLVICKTIAEAHGGRILVDSKPGNGSTFLVEIPGYLN